MSKTNRKYAGMVALALATCSVAVMAHAWELKVPFRARVHDHGFESVKMWNEGCTLNVRLVFDAPEAQYTSPEPRRNYYQFRARLRMKDNIEVVSPLFFNRTAGRRMYTFSRDTSNGGCWAETELRPHAVDVEGCRGKGCTVAEFRH
jgi:hypothetical protein